MPSTPSPLLRLELQATGENLAVWGTKLNALFTQVEQAIASNLTLTITGDRTLTASNYMENEYRRGTHTLVFGLGLAAPFTLTVPPVAFPYRIDNRTAFPATLKTATGVGAVVRPGMISTVFCDGTDCKVADPTLDQVKTAAAAVNLGGQQIQNAAAGTEANHLATVGQIPAVAATQVQLASDWAQKTGGTVDGTEYSAKLWATSTTALTGGNKGAKGYAQDAASSASASSGFASNASTSAGNSATSASNAATSETNAANSATQASGFVTQAAAQATKLTGTSTTSNAIGTGAKTFTTQAGKFFDPGARLLISSDANPTANTMFGIVTAYSGTSLTVSVTATNGTGTFSDWTIRVSGERGAPGPSGSTTVPRSARTSNTQLGIADAGTLIDFTAGPFTQTLAGASGLGSGWFAYLRNSSGSVITLDPSGTELVDGLTTILIYPGESFLLECNGASFFSVGRSKIVLLATSVVSTAVANVEFTLGFGDPEISSAFLELDNVTGGSGLAGVLGNAGGYTSTNHYYLTRSIAINSTLTDIAGSASLFYFEGSTSPSKSGIIEIAGLRRTANPSVSVRSVISGTGDLSLGAGGRTDLGTCTGLRLQLITGNITGGTIRHYGRRA